MIFLIGNRLCLSCCMEFFPQLQKASYCSVYIFHWKASVFHGSFHLAVIDRT